jgi:hypothetical protein
VGGLEGGAPAFPLAGEVGGGGGDVHCAPVGPFPKGDGRTAATVEAAIRFSDLLALGFDTLDERKPFVGQVEQGL